MCIRDSNTDTDTEHNTHIIDTDTGRQTDKHSTHNTDTDTGRQTDKHSTHNTDTDTRRQTDKTTQNIDTNTGS